ADFGGNSSSLAADPMNASNIVLKSEKTSAAATWAGTTLSTPMGLAPPIPFAQGSTFISCVVYSPTAGIPVRLKAEDHTDPTITVETEVMTSVANAWDTLVFDFSNQAPGTAAIDFTKTYDMLSIFYDFNTAGATPSNTYYLDDVFFGGGSGGGPTTHNVTFKVDMNSYTGPFNTPEVNGTFNGWCGNCIPMSDADGDGVWEVTVPITMDTIEFKFSFDNWAGQESLQQGLPCTITQNGFTNRFMVLSGDTVLDPVCWESCSACTGVPTTANVKFMVDLSDYTASSYAEVNLNGSFNNWCGSCAQMTSPNNDSIYELVVTVPLDTIEYKFTLDGWTVQENLTQGDPCTITTVDPGGTFTNRYFVPTGDTTLPVVCWESCTSCNSNISIDEDWIAQFDIHPNPSQGIINIEGVLQSAGDSKITVTNIQGRLVKELVIKGSILDSRIDMSNNKDGVYLVNITNNHGTITKKVVISK
ncbi:MAG: T9SS type A sorting domain-containing protein, partial [Schleiferiaceae bacterium]|nr:T9SS type A sorting domain-containing protein [Schleiferiaceae bacterium]